MSNGLPVCPTCKGTGTESWPTGEQLGAWSAWKKKTCPACGGTGWLISDDTIEVGRLAMDEAWEEGRGDGSALVRIGLVAVFDHLKGEAE